MRRSPSSTGWVIGIGFVVIGALLLLHTTGVADLGNLARWTPLLLVFLGVVILVVNRFRQVVAPVILIAGGVVTQLMVLGFDVVSLLWPVLIILIGVAILVGRRRRSRRATATRTVISDDANFSTVMSSTDRRVTPDDLDGREIVTVMGESKLDMRDLSVTDLPAELCVTCVMGQVNLRVPSEWSVAFDNSTVMGESKDERRSAPSSADPDLTITGTVVMGGLKIDD